MYLKPDVVVSDWEQVERFVEANPLGLLTTAIPLSGQSTIQASHLPFLFDTPSKVPSACESSSTATISTDGVWNAGVENNTDLGTLRCHLARSNPQSKALLSLPPSSSTEVLVVFSDPINTTGYITPQWYVETKPSTRKTVPTWNYAELQLYGQVQIIPPHQIVRDLSEKHEQLYAKTKQEPNVWKVEDAPENYIALLERAIIGLEIKVTKVGYKLKMSRDKSEGDRKGIIDGLKAIGSDATRQMAETVEKLGPFKRGS